MLSTYEYNGKVEVQCLPPPPLDIADDLDKELDKFTQSDSSHYMGGSSNWVKVSESDWQQ